MDQLSMKFSPGFKARMVQRMAGPEGISATALSRETGIPQPTLSRWLREARNLEAMKKKSQQNKKAVRPPHRWTPEEKLQAVIQASQLPQDQLGAFLREKGLHAAHLEAWRKAALEALQGASKSKKTSPEAKKIKALEKALQRKEKALAEMATLLALKKKLEAFLEERDDDTPPRTGTGS